SSLPKPAPKGLPQPEALHRHPLMLRPSLVSLVRVQEPTASVAMVPVQALAAPAPAIHQADLEAPVVEAGAGAGADFLRVITRLPTLMRLLDRKSSKAACSQWWLPSSLSSSCRKKETK